MHHAVLHHGTRLSFPAHGEHGDEGHRNKDRASYDFIITLRVTLGRRMVLASVEVTRFWHVCTSVRKVETICVVNFYFV